MSPRFLPDFSGRSTNSKDNKGELILFDQKVINDDSNVARLPVHLLLDNSGSMVGEPIAEVNRAQKAFGSDIAKDRLLAESLLISVVTYSTDSNEPFEVVVKAVEPSRFKPPTLRAETWTPQCKRLIEFLSRLAYERQTASKNRAIQASWVFEFSDGLANDRELEADAKKAVATALDFGIQVYLFGVGPQADLDFLRYLSQPGRPAERLPEGGWADFFSWLHRSVSRASMSQSGDEWDEDSPFGGKFRMGL